MTRMSRITTSSATPFLMEAYKGPSITILNLGLDNSISPKKNVDENLCA